MNAHCRKEPLHTEKGQAIIPSVGAERTGPFWHSDPASVPADGCSGNVREVLTVEAQTNTATAYEYCVRDENFLPNSHSCRLTLLTKALKLSISRNEENMKSQNNDGGKKMAPRVQPSS